MGPTNSEYVTLYETRRYKLEYECLIAVQLSNALPRILHSYKPASLLHSRRIHRISLNTASPFPIKMLFTTLTTLALAATGLAQVATPEGYRRVYITSKQDTKFVIVPKTRTAGATLVV